MLGQSFKSLVEPNEWLDKHGKKEKRDLLPHTYVMLNIFWHVC